MTRKSWKRVLPVLFITTLFITACGSSDKSADSAEEGDSSGSDAVVITSTSGGEVSSLDGSVKIKIPPGSFEGELEVTLERVSPDNYPSELDGMAILGDLYELGPDGTVFDDPITIVRRFDADEIGVDLSEGLPVVVLLNRDSDGNWSALEDGIVDEENGQVVVSAQTTHFSHNAAATTVELFGHSVPVQLVPSSFVKLKGKSTTVFLVVEEVDQFKDKLVAGPDWHTSDPQILRAEAPVEGEAFIVCLEKGTSDYMVDFSLSWGSEQESGISDLINALNKSGAIDTKITLRGNGECTLPDTAQVETAFRDQSFDIWVHFTETDGACFPNNFSDIYNARFIRNNGVFTLELLQNSTGQLVSGPFNAADLSFDELVDTTEAFQNGRWMLEPLTGDLLLVSDYIHDCPDGVTVNHWTMTTSMLDWLMQAMERALAELESVGEPTPDPDHVCAGGPYTLCLQHQRFQFDMNFVSPDGTPSPGQTEVVYDDYGRFFHPDLPDTSMDVLFIDACATTGSFWLFVNPPVGTNGSLTVTDTVTQQSQSYFTLGDAATPIMDPQAFATCP
jgi:hypothetical protein